MPKGKVKTKAPATIKKFAPPKTEKALAKRGRPRTVEPPADGKKKDGTDWVPWEIEVAQRLAKKQAMLDAMSPEEYTEYRKGRCSAMTTGNHGPKRPCDRYAVHGTRVCIMHGASAKQVKEAARKMVQAEVAPTLSRLVELRDQDGHLPTALGAAAHILNRALGKPGEEGGESGPKRPIINVGIAIGGIPVKGRTNHALPETTVDAEVVESDE